MNKKTLFLFCCALMIAQVSSAATVSYTDSVALSTTNWQYSVGFPQFNPSLGTLERVEFTLAAHVEGKAFFENLDSEPAEVTSKLSAQLELTDGQLVTVAIPVLTVVDTVTAFDGIIDFGGTSGRTYSDMAADRTESSVFTDPAFLAQFIGLGIIDLTASAYGQSKITGPGNLAAGFMTKASCVVTVTYVYTPPPACIGDLVWLDSDGDGLFEPAAGEKGINGVLVELYDAAGNLVATTYTANNPDTGKPGWYLFENLTPGTYIVVIPSSNFNAGGPLYGLVQTYDYDGDLDNRTDSTLGPGECFLGADFGYEPKPHDQPCTRTPGYWKNHPEAWPVETITIGGVTYTKAQAIAIIKTAEKGDKTYTIFRALVSAKLNLLVGTNPACISETILAADAWMAKYGPVGKKVAASSKAWKIGEPLYMMLDDYNNGLLCAPHCD